jgi:metal-dependent amidase/aminoacylase/carboxypeptidase family protein
VEKLKKRVEACFEAAALATGCKWKIEWKMAYADMVDSELLSSSPDLLRLMSL